MVATDFPIRYEDPIYQQTHRQLFSESLTAPLEQVLPPGVTKVDFDRVIQEFEAALGKGSVYKGQSMEDYIDPYELDEAAGKRKIPSAAPVWYEITPTPPLSRRQADRNRQSE